MPKLPKSITLDGRRYPTWALTAQAQTHIVNIHEVDAHMSVLQTRLEYQYRVREFLETQLRQALETSPDAEKESRYFWHIVPAEWFKSCWPSSSAPLDLSLLEAANLYQPQDRLVLYAKGQGAIGWGEVHDTSSGQVLEWRCRAHRSEEAVTAKTVKLFRMRHPTRRSQRIPEKADIDGLLSTMASNMVST